VSMKPEPSLSNILNALVSCSAPSSVEWFAAAIMNSVYSM